MRSPACLVAMCLLVACSNAPLTTSLTATSPSPSPDVFACAREQLKTIDFDQSSLDIKDQRLTARKIDYTQRRPDVQFNRIVDRLEIEAVPSGGASATKLTVNARTFGEYTTQRGPTEVQERTSDTARKAAQTVIEHCGGQVAPSAAQG
jgi:hypothetical protein